MYLIILFGKLVKSWWNHGCLGLWKLPKKVFIWETHQHGSLTCPRSPLDIKQTLFPRILFDLISLWIQDRFSLFCSNTENIRKRVICLMSLYFLISCFIMSLKPSVCFYKMTGRLKNDKLTGWQKNDTCDKKLYSQISQSEGKTAVLGKAHLGI